MAGNVVKITPKGTQHRTNLGLRGQLFGFWANCVFVQLYDGLAIFSRSGRSRNHQKTTSKSALEKNRRKSDRNTGKIPKSTPKVVPWGSPLEPKGDEKSSKIDAGPPPGSALGSFLASRGLRGFPGGCPDTKMTSKTSFLIPRRP